MSKNSIRICKCCGTQYEYCNHCNKKGPYEPWKNLCDTYECREILNVVSAYNMGLVKDDGILAVIQKYNITDFSKYLDTIANVLNKVYTSNQKSNQKESSKKTEEISKDESKYKKNRYSKYMDVELNNEEETSV